MMKPRLSDGCRFARLLFASPMLFIFSAGSLRADVALTSGSISDSYGYGAASDTILLQGPNLSLSGSYRDGGLAFFLGAPALSPDGKTMTFDPNQSISIQGTLDGFPMVFTYNGVNYTSSATPNSQWVVVSANFSGPLVTVPNIPPENSPPGGYYAAVGNVPFKMTGTVSVYASNGGALILSVPVSGSGFYSSYSDHFETGGPGGVPSGSTTYQLQPGFTLDTTTQGSWPGKYGLDGFWIANGASLLPSYAQVSTAASTYTWASSTSDVRALQNGPTSSNRIASTFTPPNYTKTFSFSVNMTDGLNHPVALYFLDFDGAGRVENITITDGLNNVINQQSLSSFQNGVYGIWNLQGNFTITATATNGSPVLGGIFFGQGSAAPVPPGFTLSASLASAMPGSSGLSTVTVNPTGGFNGPVTLSSSTNWSPGITGSFGTNPTTTLSSVVTINVASNVNPGTYYLPVFGSDGPLIASAYIPLTVTPLGLGSSATYTGLDTSTEGAWNGKYGGDGFMIASGASSVPSYASVTVTGASTYTWAQLTSDPRALQTGTGATSGIASSYYGSSFSINVSLSDGNTHQVALYLLDFDTTTRAESITILDAATNTALDQENFTGFHNGQWAVWNIKGNVVIKVLSKGSPSAVFSGIFFGAGGPVSPGFSLSASSVSIAQGASGTTTITETPAPAGGIIDVTLITTGWPTGITPGTQFNFNLGVNVASTVQPGVYMLPLSAQKGSVSSSTTIPLTVTTPTFGTTASATYTGSDTITGGAWNGQYGANGYMIANGPTATSGNASGSVVGNSTYTWAGQTSDQRALNLPGTFVGIASAYTQYPSNSFTINVQTAGQVQVALYLLDWDTTSRSETISVVDAATGLLLTTQTFSNFHNGQYAKWNVSGNVIFKVTPVGPSSPVVSGVFFN